MNKYFILLNWLILAAIVGIYCLVVPLLHTYAVLAGSILGAMCTAGLITWQFHKDSNTDKERKWSYRYFNKDYRIEVCVQFVLLIVFTLLGIFLWRYLHFVTGFIAIYTLNLLVEWLYARHLKRYR